MKKSQIFCIILYFTFLIFNCLYADSWPEKPDYDFYAHPLVGMSKSNDRFTIGKVLNRVGKQGQKETLNVKLFNGKIVIAEKYESDVPILTKRGTPVLLSRNKYFDETVVVDYDRSSYLSILAVLFILTVLIVGGIKKLTGLVAVGAGIIF